jgi:hypothetical protein
MFDADPDYKMLIELFKNTNESKTSFDGQIEQINYGLLYMSAMHESHYGRCPILLKYEEGGSAIEPSKLSEKFKLRSCKSQIEKLIAGLPRRCRAIETKNSSQHISSIESKTVCNGTRNELPKSESLSPHLTLVNKATSTKVVDSLGYLINSSLNGDVLRQKRMKRIVGMTSLMSCSNEGNVNSSVDEDIIPPEYVVAERIQVPVCNYINNSKHWEENRRWKLPIRVK